MCNWFISRTAQWTWTSLLWPRFGFGRSFPLDVMNLFPSLLPWQHHVNKVILLFNSFHLETHCFYMYCLRLNSHLGSLCFLHLLNNTQDAYWKARKVCGHILQIYKWFISNGNFSVCICLSCLSLGCISSWSLSLHGRGAGAPQSGIYNLWAAGPCQGAAATQHVSTPQAAVSSSHLQPGFLVPSLVLWRVWLCAWDVSMNHSQLC